MVACVLAGLIVLPAQSSRTSLLLVTLDTVRADRLGSYGYELASTPALDRLAREGIRFADATTPSPLTGPAHVALLTGRYPARYGVRDNAAAPIPPEAVTLAETLQAAGYRTAAFIGAFVLDRPYGFAQGFERFDARFDGFVPTAKLQAQRPADAVVRPALDWISSLGAQQPFFAWVHLYDAHTPYAPPAPYGSTFRARPYDGEIAYVDAAIGRIVDRLAARGALDRTVVMAVADHGESLGEHGEQEHGLFLYEAVLRVPWIVRLPGRSRAGTVVEEQVRAIDLVPTALDLLGIKAAGPFDGERLTPLLQGGRRSEPPPAFAETYYPQLHFGWSYLTSIRTGAWKLIDAPKPELYDLREDPAERRNVIYARTAVHGRLAKDRQRLEAALGAPAAASAPAPDAATLARLRSLGYVGIAAPVPAGARGADPKDMVGTLERFRTLLSAALDDLHAGRSDAAIGKLKQLIAINDRAYDLHLFLGEAYRQKRQYEPALGEYAAAAVLNPSSAAPLVGTAEALLEQGNAKQALRKLDEAATLEPTSPEVAFTRGRAYERLEQDGEAFSEYQRSVLLNGSDPRPRAALANVASRLLMLDVVEEQLRTLLVMGYQPARTHLGLGRLAAARGDRARAIAEYRKALALDPGLQEAKKALQELGKN